MSDQSLRGHVIYLLEGGGAHLDFEQAIAGLPVELRGVTVDGVPHTAWRLVEHLRICLWDILEFSRNPQHVSPEFPDGYWPASPEGGCRRHRMGVTLLSTVTSVRALSVRHPVGP